MAVVNLITVVDRDSVVDLKSRRTLTSTSTGATKTNCITPFTRSVASLTKGSSQDVSALRNRSAAARATYNGTTSGGSENPQKPERLGNRPLPMPLLEEIQEKVAAHAFESSKHAVDQGITLYEADPDRRIDFKTRRS